MGPNFFHNFFSHIIPYQCYFMHFEGLLGKILQTSPTLKRGPRVHSHLLMLYIRRRQIF